MLSNIAHTFGMAQSSGCLLTWMSGFAGLAGCSSPFFMSTVIGASQHAQYDSIRTSRSWNFGERDTATDSMAHPQYAKNFPSIQICTCVTTALNGGTLIMQTFWVVRSNTISPKL